MSALIRRFLVRIGACGAAAAVGIALCCTLAPFGAPAFADEDGEAEGNWADEMLTGYGSADESGYVAPSDEGSEDVDVTAEDEDATETVQEPTTSNEGVDEEDPGKNLVDPTQRADNSFIYDTSIGAISGQSSLYDNRTVQVEGEVIGDRVAEGPGYYWIELSSYDEGDTATISVLLSEDQTAQIDRYGRYGVTGTTLQVRGTYHQACDEHEGLSDIHATNSAVVARGVDHQDVFDFGAFLPGILTIGIGVILLLVFRFARERMR